MMCHLWQGSGVLIRDKVRPEEYLGCKEPLMAHAAGLGRSRPRVLKGQRPAVLLAVLIVLAEFL